MPFGTTFGCAQYIAIGNQTPQTVFLFAVCTPVEWVMDFHKDGCPNIFVFTNTQNTFYPPATGWVASSSCQGITPPTLSFVLPVK